MSLLGERHSFFYAVDNGWKCSYNGKICGDAVDRNTAGETRQHSGQEYSRRKRGKNRKTGVQ